MGGGTVCTAVDTVQSAKRKTSKVLKKEEEVIKVMASLWKWQKSALGTQTENTPKNERHGAPSRENVSLSVRANSKVKTNSMAEVHIKK